MDTVRPKKNNLVPCAPLHDALMPLNPILRPYFSIDYNPVTGLILTGTIAGLTQWYEEDKLQDQEPDWLGLAVPNQLVEITGLYLSYIHHIFPSQDSRDWFFELALQMETWPKVDYQAETVSWQLSPEQCQELLEALDA